MRISRLMVPAVTLAGALALAGCGGGSNNNPGTPDDDDLKSCPAPNGKLMVEDLADCPMPPDPAGSDAPLTGDDLAEAEALKTALGAAGLTTDLTVAGGIMETASGKKGTPAEDKDDPWKDSTVAPAVGGGWTARGYEREKDDAEENIVSYSSGEPFVDQSLAAFVSGMSVLNLRATATGSDLNSGDDADVRTAEFLHLAAADYDADLFPSGFVSAKDADSDKDGTQIEGMFAGIAGTFSCAATCNRSTDQDGMITLDQAWTFEPDGRIHRLDVAAKYSENPNPGFMTFGYWWSEEEGRDGKPVFVVDAFADGEVARGASSALPGANGVVSASYSGKASGAYVREVLEGGKKVPAAAGLFTADVTLNAVFAASDKTVQGSVHDFMDGSTPISDWKLALKGVVARADGAFNGTAGDGGTYRGQFYGGEAAKAPAGAAGVFDSGNTFANGRAAGAFGVGLDD